MNRVLIDTNIFVNVLNKEKGLFESSKQLIENVQEGLLIGFTSVICISEILSGFYDEAVPQIAEKVLQNIQSIQNLSILDYNLDIAVDAARIRGVKKLKLPDAVIVSQAKQVGATLISRDKALLKQNIVKCLLPENFNQALEK